MLSATLRDELKRYRNVQKLSTIGRPEWLMRCARLTVHDERAQAWSGPVEASETGTLGPPRAPLKEDAIH